MAALGLSLALPGAARAAADLDINPMPPTFQPYWSPVPKSPGVEFAANLPTDVFRYQNQYYIYWDKKLYQSSKPSGPWKHVSQEPSWFKGIDKSYFKMLERAPKAPPFAGARPLPPKPKPPMARRPMKAAPGMTPHHPTSRPGLTPHHPPSPAGMTPHHPGSPAAGRPAAPPLTPGRHPLAVPPKAPALPAPAAVSRPRPPAVAPVAPQAQTPQPTAAAQTPPAAALAKPPARPGAAPAKKPAPAASSGAPKQPKAM
jgi:hypothetical protein